MTGRLRDQAGAEERVDPIEFEREIDLSFRDEPGGAFEELQGGVSVAAKHRAAAGGGQVPASGGRERLIALLAVLLEVASEALVQTGPHRLRQPFVAGRADQEMAKAKGVVSGQVPAVRQH